MADRYRGRVLPPHIESIRHELERDNLPGEVLLRDELGRVAEMVRTLKRDGYGPAVIALYAWLDEYDADSPPAAPAWARAAASPGRADSAQERVPVVVVPFGLADVRNCVKALRRGAGGVARQRGERVPLSRLRVDDGVRVQDEGLLLRGRLSGLHGRAWGCEAVSHRLRLDFSGFNGTVVLGSNHVRKCAKDGRTIGKRGKSYRYTWTPNSAVDVCRWCHGRNFRRSMKTTPVTGGPGGAR